jgi:hypothetical protein
MNSPIRFLIVPALAASFTAACSSSSSSHPAATTAEVLDPTQSHYGNSYCEWGALWWKWLYQLTETSASSCVVPLSDPTGQNCGYEQSGDVFFLVGTLGGTVVRNMCTVPQGKAIFFPILSFDADNGGVPVAMQLTPMALQAVVQGQVDKAPVSGLSAEFDGLPVANMASFKCDATQYSYTLPAEPNLYDCLGMTGVTGMVSPAYAGGYYVMLPPPAPGNHVLKFKGSSPSSTPPLTVDVTYNFTVKAQ